MNRINETSHSPLPKLQNAYPSSLTDWNGGMMLECCARSTDTDEEDATGQACEMARPKRVVRDQSGKMGGEKESRRVSIC
jgi:hypothetical protein